MEVDVEQLIKNVNDETGKCHEQIMKKRNELSQLESYYNQLIGKLTLLQKLKEQESKRDDTNTG